VQWIAVMSHSNDGQCTGLTTFPPSCANSKSGSLNLLEPSGPVQPCSGCSGIALSCT